MATITRSALYALVWADPVSTVAARLGLKGWKLTEVCSRFNVPVPPSGWWTKKRLGKPVEPTPLAAGEDVIIELQQSATLAPDQPPIVVPEHITRYHPLVEQTRRVLTTLKPDKPPSRQLLVTRDKALAMAVSKTQMSRALRIMDTLVRALEARGYGPSLPAKGAGLKLAIDGEVLYVALDEKCKRQPRPRTKWEQDSFDRGWNTREPYDLVPSGVLALQIRGWEDSKWVSYEMAERPTAPLEHSLSRFIVKLRADAARSKAQKEHWERQRQADAERERRLREEEERRLAERKREEQWDSWMANWKKAQDVRAFASALEEQLGSGNDLAEQLAWARRYADRLDPLMKEPA